jgi:hypothetical protein
VRSDSEFAAAEVRKHQGRADRAETQHRELLTVLGGEGSRLIQYAKQVGGDGLATYLEQYNGLISNDQMKAIITNYQATGQVYGSGPEVGDVSEEYMTPDEKRLKTLEERNAHLEGRLNALTSSSVTAAWQGHLEGVAKEYYLTDAEFGEVKAGLEGQARQWGTNEQGRQLLQSLQDPNSYTTVEALALKHVPKEVLFAMGERKRLHDRKQVEGFATDGPPDSSTTGQEPPPEFKDALSALKAAKADPSLLKRLGY